jgi:4-amino-4-deoxy-L-arabinose transferase-like glycosyltransferase
MKDAAGERIAIGGTTAPDSSRDSEDESAVGPLRLEARPSRRVRGLAALLLVAHGTLIGLSLPRNAITVDEVSHLPAGISYWHHGRFWCYHHNPPFVRLLFALPAVLGGVPTDYRNYEYVPGSRVHDWLVGRDFMLLNRNRYLEIFMLPRAVVAALSVLGGYIVYLWSRQLFGCRGGLISLALWTFCPNVLANAGLVSCDIGATVVGLLATYQFWRYLRAPTLIGAGLTGVVLGLAEASKFSMVILPPTWIALALIKILTNRRAGVGARLTASRAFYHGVFLGTFALLALNDIYLFEGSGRRLGSFDFRSKLLTKEIQEGNPAPRADVLRVNRFRGTLLGRFPVPLPEHYLLGFDDQSFDVDSIYFYKYLRGKMRYKKNGWYYYYIYGLLVKTPLGTLGLVATSVLSGFSVRRCRADRLSETCLFLLPLAILLLISSQRGLNSHLRYVLPAMPFVFITAGRLGPLTVSSRAWSLSIVTALTATAASVLAVHPHYLTYFNEAAGGPDRGMEHLAESNIDWGQGLVALREWLARNAPGQTINLAYYGTMYPEILGIAYKLPIFGPDLENKGRRAAMARPIGPSPGLHAVSVNFLLGFPFAAPNAHGSQSGVPANAYLYYQKFRPRAIVAHSIFIYDLNSEEVDRVRRELGLPPWSDRSKNVPK